MAFVKIPQSEIACPDSRSKHIMRLSDLKRYSLRTSFSEEPPGWRRDYPLLIASQSRVLCRGEQLLLRFSGEGSRLLKPFRASVAFQGAE